MPHAPKRVPKSGGMSPGSHKKNNPTHERVAGSKKSGMASHAAALKRAIGPRKKKR